MVAVRAMDEAEMMPKGVESMIARACCFFGQKMRGKNDVRSRMSEEFLGIPKKFVGIPSILDTWPCLHIRLLGPALPPY